MKKSQFFVILFFLAALLFSGSNVSAEKNLYDDFSTGYIDGNKWSQREFVLEIVNGKFVSKIGNRSPGMSAEIYPGLFRNNLGFVNPDSIYSIECEVTLVEAKLDSGQSARSFARISGNFYNVNDTGGRTGDISFEIMIGERGNNGIEAFWEVSQVLTDDGTNWTEIANGTLIGPNNLQYNTPYTVKLAYDNDRTFTFSVNQISDSYIGPVKRRGPVVEGKSLATCIDAINGSNNGFISATFDNVRINNQTVIYDDFSSGLINRNKWGRGEWIREVSTGYLRANIIGNGSTEAVSTYLTEKDTPYLETKVFIDSDSQLSAGAWGIGRLQGYYYNDSRGSGSGQPYNEYEGDVFAQVRLRYNSNGTLSANAYVDRSNDAEENNYTNLFTHNFSVPIKLDTYYTLSIRLEGKKLIFQCDDEKTVYNIITPLYPAYGEHRLLRSRVHLDPGETGYLKVRFDDVYIETKGKGNPSIPLLLLSE
jgi:hypothetical protein